MEDTDRIQPPEARGDGDLLDTFLDAYGLDALQRDSRLQTVLMASTLLQPPGLCATA